MDFDIDEDWLNIEKLLGFKLEDISGKLLQLAHSMAQTKEGVGIIAIMAGSLMKQAGFNPPIQVLPPLKQITEEYVIRDGWIGREGNVQATKTMNLRDFLILHDNDPDKTCRALEKGVRDQLCTLKSDLIVDESIVGKVSAFFNYWRLLLGLPLIAPTPEIEVAIKKFYGDFGKIGLADIFLMAGFTILGISVVR